MVVPTVCRSRYPCRNLIFRSYSDLARCLGLGRGSIANAYIAKVRLKFRRALRILRPKVSCIRGVEIGVLDAGIGVAIVNGAP